MNDSQDKPSVIDPVYLPFTREQLLDHFLDDKEGQVAYYEESASRYHRFCADRSDPCGIPIKEARYPCQIQKDERFWTATSLKRLVESGADPLIQVLRSAFGDRPPIAGFSDWSNCVEGDLQLILEATLPSPHGYVDWLRKNLASRHFIPYVLNAAQRPGLRTFEGPTHVDGLIINVKNGFSVLVEAKVLSDISTVVSFDMFRNQLARNLDVLLEPRKGEKPLGARSPDSSLFALLTPQCFKANPHSRLYGQLFEEYTLSASSIARDLRHPIARDLPHRNLTREDSEGLRRRIGWITFEDIAKAVPGACQWLEDGG